MDATNRNTALASALCEELARSGVKRAVICPGSRSTPIALALLREPGIETTSVVDERSAGFLALGMAVASRVPVVIVTTSGTAAANLHPAVAEANEASVPLIVLTGDRPPELRGVGAGQTIDQIGLYGSAARWFCEVGTHDADDAGLIHLRSVACRAYSGALGDPHPGPVHLNLAWRDPLGPEPAEGDVIATGSLALHGRGELPLTEVHAPAASLEASQTAAIASDIAECERGLIIAGRTTRDGIAEAVARLSEATGYPVLAEPTSQIRFGPHDRSRVVTAYDTILRDPPPALAPELIIRFGDMPTSKPLRTWLGKLDETLQLVVDPAATWNEPTRKAAVSLRADPVGLAGALADRLADASGRTLEFTRAWLAADESARKALSTGISRLTGLGSLTEPGLHVALGQAYADGDLVVLASSMPIRDHETFVEGTDADVAFLSNRGANGIDGTISSGVGAALATGRPLWVILGDLALHHDSNGLSLLRHLDQPARIVCVNNNGGGIFEFLPQASQVERSEFEAIFGTPMDLDIAALAQGHGVTHRVIEQAHQLAEPPSHHVVYEVPADRSANVALHRGLGEKAAAAVVQALAAD